jgi:phenylacetate-CoA ligase
MERKEFYPKLSSASREQIEQLQLKKLIHQLDYIYNTNEFYRQKMKDAKVFPDKIKTIGDFTKRMPLSTKLDLLKDQEANPPFGKRLGVPREKITCINLTGGTSGMGQEIYGRTYADINHLGTSHYLVWYLAGLRKGDVAVNCVPSGGLTTGGWGPPEGIRMVGATPIHLSGVTGSEGRVKLLQRFKVINFMYSSVAYLNRLTQVVKDMGLDPRKEFPGLKSIYISAEAFPLEWGILMEEFWGAKLHEGYGSTQALGWCATTCENGAIVDKSRGVMHCLEWRNVIELINPETGEPAKEGEEGEIIITNLDVEASPLVRFSTRDKARELEMGTCSCGRKWLALEAGTVTRYDDMLKIKGNNVWPVTVDEVTFSHKEIAEYKGTVYVDEKGREVALIEFAYKPEYKNLPKAEKDTLISGLRTKIKEKTNVLMDFKEVERSALPEFEYKARRWKDLRQETFSKK